MIAGLPSFTTMSGTKPLGFVSLHVHLCLPLPNPNLLTLQTTLDPELAMKLKFLPLIAVLATPFVTTTASAGDQIAESICSYIAANDKNSLRKTLSDSRMRLKNVYDGVACDGLPMIRFAIKHNAADTAEFIIKQLPGSQIAKMGDAEWAASNGFAQSPVIEALKARSSS